MRLIFSLCAVWLAATPVIAAESAKPDSKPSAEGAKKDSTTSQEPVVTHHLIAITGKPLKYSVTTGRLPLKNETGETEAELFFIAYAAEGAGPPESRPLTFSF